MRKQTKFKINNQRDIRINQDLQLLQELCNRSNLINFEVVYKTKTYTLEKYLDSSKKVYLPEEFLIHYSVKSIVGIKNNMEPIYSNKHIAKITLPKGYPMTSQPKCYMVTDVWHPNIRSHEGEHKGHICINPKALGQWHTLDMLIERIGSILQYKNYHAESTAPYPEDSVVATWVRDYAEKNDWVNKAKGIYVDDRPLLNPLPDIPEDIKPEPLDLGFEITSIRSTNGKNKKTTVSKPKKNQDDDSIWEIKRK